MKAAAVIAGLCVASPAHADCLPAADLSGDADIAAEVARALAHLGVVFAEADNACPAVHAKVTADVAGVAVTVQDARGRIEGRVVADAGTAAAWIESWANDDAEPLWSATPALPEPVVVEVAAAPAPPSATPVEDVVVVAPVTKPRWRLPEVTARLERDLANDGSAWNGVGVASCLTLGRLCVGVAGKYGANNGFTNTGGLTAYDRSVAAMSATIAVRASIAKVELSPELAVGAGATTTSRREPTEPCFDPDGTMPCANMPLYIGDGFAARTFAPRIGASMGMQVPLAGWLALDARVGAEAMPGAHTAPHVPDAMLTPPDPTAPIAPGDPLLDLPGEPGWAWTAAVGLSMEMP